MNLTLLEVTSARSVMISLPFNQVLSSQVNALQDTESKLMSRKKLKTILE